VSYSDAKFTLEVDIKGDALRTDTSGELARILHKLADRVADGADAGTLMDINGNAVGTWVIR
jgi:hypothetical protein